MALGEEPRLLSTRLLQDFVVQTGGSWSPGQWRDAVTAVRKAGFHRLPEERLKQLVDENRERWLARGRSDQPVGAASEGMAEKAEERKEQNMGEKKKPEPPRPEPAKPAPAKIEAARPAPAKPGAPEEKPAYADIDGDGVLDEVLSNPAQAQEKHQRRLALLKRNQDFTRESMDTEIEIRRLENVQMDLQNNLNLLAQRKKGLDEQRKELQGDADGISKEVSQLREGTEKLGLRRAQLEEQVGQHKKQRAEHVAAISRMKAEREGLIS